MKLKDALQANSKDQKTKTPLKQVKNDRNVNYQHGLFIFLSCPWYKGGTLWPRLDGGRGGETGGGIYTMIKGAGKWEWFFWIWKFMIPVIFGSSRLLGDIYFWFERIEALFSVYNSTYDFVDILEIFIYFFVPEWKGTIMVRRRGENERPSLYEGRRWKETCEFSMMF